MILLEWHVAERYSPISPHTQVAPAIGSIALNYHGGVSPHEMSSG